MWNRSIFSSVFDASPRNVFCASALPNSKLITDSQVYVYRMLNQRFIPGREARNVHSRHTRSAENRFSEPAHHWRANGSRAFSSRSRAPMSMKQRIFTYSSSVNGSTHTQEREIKKTLNLFVRIAGIMMMMKNFCCCCCSLGGFELYATRFGYAIHKEYVRQWIKNCFFLLGWLGKLRHVVGCW